MRLLREFVFGFVALSFVLSVSDNTNSDIGEIYNGISLMNENIDSEGFDSDLLKLYTSPSSVDNRVDGLYAKTNFDSSQIVCELKGNLIPISSMYYGSSLPIVFNNITRQSYALEGNSACHHIQDCVNVSSSSLDVLDNCQYNSYFQMTELGKIFLINYETVEKNGEFFASFGK